jgi:hypothetical protein
MATSDIRNILKGGGRLVKDPTSVSGSFPHGGTELGIVRAIEFVPEVQTQEIIAEEWGGARVEDVMLGERAILVGILRTYDADALASLFPNTAAGAGGRLINGRVKGTVKAGERIGPARSVKLLFVANAPTRDPSLLIYRALPRVDSSARLGLVLSAEWGLPFAFEATPDDNAAGRIYQMGKLADLSI